MHTMAFSLPALLLVATFTRAKRVTLTPATDSIDGATITVLHDTNVNASANEWEINCTSRQFFAMQISLDASWGFNASVPSNTTFLIHSATPTQTSADLELILAFSVNNSRYWSTEINTKQANANTMDYHKVGPQCDTNVPPLPTSRLFSDDVKAKMDENIGLKDRDTVAMPRKHEWQPIESVFYFPLQITIEHDPINAVMYIYHVQANYTQKCGFAETFEAEQGLQIYFHVENVGESVSVQSFDIEYVVGVDGDAMDTTMPPPTASGDSAVPSPSLPARFSGESLAIIALALLLACSFVCITVLIYDRRRKMRKQQNEDMATVVVTVPQAAERGKSQSQKLGDAYNLNDRNICDCVFVGNAGPGFDMRKETAESDTSLMYDSNLKLESERTRQSSASCYPNEGRRDASEPIDSQTLHVK
mmetsp:Transcript_43396/g.71686  ORF Transcript_43396/g.71686 Transcript_43396/m.71686 type:complete len:420 (+) Transcript_43396:19-1278(+)